MYYFNIHMRGWGGLGCDGKGVGVETIWDWITILSRMLTHAYVYTVGIHFF